MRISLERSLAAIWACLAAVVLSAAAISVTEAAEKLPEIDSDGLHLLKDTDVRIAYAKPGATLGKYTKVMLVDCYVDFVKNWQHDYNLNEVGLEGRVTDKDAEKIKQRLAEEFRKVFTEELTKKGYPVVEQPAPDVLLLRPALINVDVVAPDLMTAGMSRTYIRSAGAMTLYLELYDSATSTLLARVIDPKADNAAFAQHASRATNTAAADRMLRAWADILAKHLDEVAK